MAKSPRLKKAVRAFLRQYDNPRTRRSYRAGLDNLLAVLGPKQRLHRVTPGDLDRWRSGLAGRECRYASHPTRPDQRGGLTAATLANRVRTVRRFFNWCVHRGYIKASPARFLSLRRSRQSLRSKAIPAVVLAGMLDAVRHKRQRFNAARDYAILTLMATYGARASDVAWLTLPALDVEKREITFVGKGGDAVTLPLTDGALDALHPWLKIRLALIPLPAHDALFTTVRGEHGPLKPDSVSELVARLSEQVCGRRYRAHSIRHWRGQSLADARVPPTIVQAILRHRSLEITLRHYYNQDFERIAAVLGEHGVVVSDRREWGRVLSLPLAEFSPAAR